ncbi:hypothetical protein SNEBB_000382 [Seison nebaliae]|nr:hypothetical protein SNEBB_000382 [Seison nebaliae]
MFKLNSFIFIIFLYESRFVSSFIYLHSPRGSNNRLKETSSNVKNIKRLFHSNNLLRGGYNVGVNEKNEEYQQKFYGSDDNDNSIYRIEWTLNGGCGKKENIMRSSTCSIVIDTLCHPEEMKERLSIESNNCVKSEYGSECEEERNEINSVNSFWNTEVILNDNKFCHENRTKKLSFCRCMDPKSKEKKKFINCNYKNECDEKELKARTVYKYQFISTGIKSRKECEKLSNSRWTIPFDAIEIEEKCIILPKPFYCLHTPDTKTNILSNVDGEIESPFYNWKLPVMSSNIPSHICTLRIRYFLQSNKGEVKGEVKELQFGNKKTFHRIRIKTIPKQIVFEDRSHSFILRHRPDELKSKRIWNVNVRGKRGNIVQNFPSVEYDFTPNILQMKKGDVLHVQWTGSNTHKNEGPSEGQTGADGQGTTGTDRNNFMEINRLDNNYISPFEYTKFWGNVRPLLQMHNHMSSSDIAMYYASSGFFCTEEGKRCREDSEEEFDPLLNKISPSIDGIPLEMISSNSSFYFIGTRNNNFSNRSQKMTIVVE